MPPSPDRTPLRDTFTMPGGDLKASELELGEFTKAVTAMIAKRDFKGLEKEAESLSSSKARFIGGGWKIHSLYILVTAPAETTESGWQSQIAFAKDWMNSISGSATAASVLAHAYISYAWKARGTTLAKDVSERSWDQFHERLELAADILREPSLRENPCHLYYEVLLQLSLGQNWDRATAEGAFAEAVAFDLDYDYYYMQRAGALLPKWGGKPGEWEAFAQHVKETRGIPRGPHLYYRIVAEMMSESSPQFFGEFQPSWASAKEGFQLLAQKYGLSKRLLNEFASMAFNARDSRVTCMAFMQIGGPENFDPEMWQNRWKYETARGAAIHMCSMPSLDNQAP